MACMAVFFTACRATPLVLHGCAVDAVAQCSCNTLASAACASVVPLPPCAVFFGGVPLAEQYHVPYRPFPQASSPSIAEHRMPRSGHLAVHTSYFYLTLVVSCSNILFIILIIFLSLSSSLSSPPNQTQPAPSLPIQKITRSTL